MRTFTECLPCMVRQAHEAAAVAVPIPAQREALLRSALHLLAESRFDQSPPHLATAVHRLIRERTGCADPYRLAKARFIHAALALYPRMLARVAQAPDPFAMALRVAIAGNAIDLGAPGCPSSTALEPVLEEVLTTPLVGVDPRCVQEAAVAAKSVLVLADNAGETVFDRCLLSRLPRERCAYVVKGAPVINDATLDDAQASGLLDEVEVFGNGSDAPGTILDWCSPEMVARFWQADLVLAKGQGNYETLHDAGHPQLYFLFKVKCAVIARDVGCPTGSFVVHRG